MADILQIKRSLTTSTVPGAGTLAEGELAINIPDQLGWIGDTNGDPILIISPSGSINATDVVYDNASSGLTATNVQAAIDELDSILDTHLADTNNPHNVTTLQISAAPFEHGHDGGIYA